MKGEVCVTAAVGWGRDEGPNVQILWLLLFIPTAVSGVSTKLRCTRACAEDPHVKEREQS